MITKLQLRRKKQGMYNGCHYLTESFKNLKICKLCTNQYTSITIKFSHNWKFKVSEMLQSDMHQSIYLNFHGISKSQFLLQPPPTLLPLNINELMLVQ